jgi:hypothetical protein
MITYRGIARGKTIELDEPLPYPEGEPINVSVEPLKSTHPPGSPAAILEAVRQLPPLPSDLVDELERAIEESKVPARYEGIFDVEP